MICKLATKSTVNWDVCPAIEAAQDTIAKTYLLAGSKAIVTSCHDGRHSFQSAHHQAEADKKSSAVDMRITNLFSRTPILEGEQWWRLVASFAKTLAANLARHLEETKTPGRFDVVIEASPPHIHIEYSDTRPNIKGWVADQFVYPTEEVRGYLA